MKNTVEELEAPKASGMAQNIIKRARFLEHTQMRSDEEPEIGIDEENGMITIGKYNEHFGNVHHIESVCSVDDVDMDELRDALDDENIAYVL